LWGKLLVCLQDPTTQIVLLRKHWNLVILGIFFIVSCQMFLAFVSGQACVMSITFCCDSLEF
jgi:hypothetical protein